LGTLGGSESEALAINEAGQVVGWARTASGRAHGFIWQNGIMRDLGALSPDGYTEAWGINNVGQVVGFSGVSGGVHSFLWQDGIMTDLTPTGDSRSWCFGINESGQITGQTGQPTSVNPFLWQNGQTVVITGYGADGTGEGLGINNLGQIVGDYTSGGYNHAFGWDRGVFTDLGFLPGGYSAKAVGINDAGQVVGQADTRAFLLVDGVMTDLNSFLPPDSGWVLYGANAINQNGQIVGWGTLNGITRAFLLTPPIQSLAKPYISSPTNGQTCFTTEDIPFTVMLPAAASGVTQVDIRESGTPVGVATKLPSSGPLISYSGVWHHPPQGIHALVARAIYDSGSVTTSRTVNISVSLPPAINYARGDRQLALSWAVTPGGFLLESATNLQPPIIWLPATSGLEVLNGTNRATIGISNTSRFFRLRKQN
jgi:probable HAF family extracellular repeat protein